MGRTSFGWLSFVSGERFYLVIDWRYPSQFSSTRQVFSFGIGLTKGTVYNGMRLSID